MFTKPLTIVAIAITASLGSIGAAVSPAMAADTDSLVTKVRTAGAWRGVEVERIRHSDQSLQVLGTDRSGREVTMTMSCEQLGFTCENTDDGSFKAVAR